MSAGKKTDGSTVRVEHHFIEAWKATWPGVPLVDYHTARDRKILKGLVEKLGEEGTTALIDDFFKAVLTDPVVSRVNNPNVPSLAYHAQHLLLRKARRRPAQRTAEHLEEAKKAMGK